MLTTLIFGGLLVIASVFFIRRGLAPRKRNEQEEKAND